MTFTDFGIMKRIFFVFFACVVAVNGSAQQKFMDYLEGNEVGKGKVIVHQDEVIEALVNGTRLVNFGKNTQGSDSLDPGMELVAGGKTYSSKITTQGYRIQVYSGGNSRSAKEQASQKGRLVKELFSEVPVYTHFYSPRWTCRIGDFKTYEEASRMLRLLKETGKFGEAVIVKSKIQIAN